MGKLVYEIVDGWGELPEGWVYTQVPGIAVDSHDRVYVFNRGLHPVIVYDREGKFLSSWGEGVFKTPHGIFVDSDDNIFCVDSGDHTVRKFDVEGKLLLKLGSEGEPGGVGEPFNRPTDAAVSSKGDIFVTDGYGNSRVHRFTSQGEFLLSWGEPGDGPGQFDIPHGVWVDRDDRVWVADRQNNRLQIFTEEGGYLDEWTGFSLPCSVYIDKLDRVYVSELRSRVSVLSIEGELLTRWGGEKSVAPGEFVAPHCAWVDSHGDLYVGEALEGQRIQKFALKKSGS